MIEQFIAQNPSEAAELLKRLPQQDAAAIENAAPAVEFDENDRSTWGNPGRNSACPCGSGKKFKHCHGELG